MRKYDSIYKLKYILIREEYINIDTEEGCQYKRFKHNSPIIGKEIIFNVESVDDLPGMIINNKYYLSVGDFTNLYNLLKKMT